MSKNNGNDEDFIAEGFHQLDEKYISRRPPKIKWGHTYKAWTPQEKVEWLEKFAHSMNHAASLLQDERDELNRFLFLKEDQLKQMSKAMAQNSEMLQSEVGKMNEQRQGYNATIKKLDAEIKELKDGHRAGLGYPHILGPSS